MYATALRHGCVEREQILRPIERAGRQQIDLAVDGEIREQRRRQPGGAADRASEPLQ